MHYIIINNNNKSTLVCINILTSPRAPSSCGCAAGMTGERCDLVRDACISAPCVNDASCLNDNSNEGGAVFKCNCASQWKGRCVCVCVHMCMGVCGCVWICIFVRWCMCVCVCVCVQYICGWVGLWICVFVRWWM